MSFDLLAKSLINQPSRASKGDEGKLEKANALMELIDAGFSRESIFNDLRNLYDSTEDDSIKKQILDMAIKVHGLYKDDDRRDTPQIIFNIIGKEDRVADMLCPPMASPC